MHDVEEKLVERCDSCETIIVDAGIQNFVSQYRRLIDDNGEK